jgi:hypothetical protein
VRHFSFEPIEQAIQQLLGCRQDARSFLSAEHMMVGEIEDDLAQAYAALGTVCFHFLPCVFCPDPCLSWLILSVLN